MPQHQYACWGAGGAGADTAAGTALGRQNVDLEALTFTQGSHFMANKRCHLPPTTLRTAFKVPPQKARVLQMHALFKMWGLELCGVCKRAGLSGQLECESRQPAMANKSCHLPPSTLRTACKVPLLCMHVSPFVVHCPASAQLTRSGPQSSAATCCPSALPACQPCSWLFMGCILQQSAFQQARSEWCHDLVRCLTEHDRPCTPRHPASPQCHMALLGSWA